MSGAEAVELLDALEAYGFAPRLVEGQLRLTGHSGAQCPRELLERVAHLRAALAAIVTAENVLAAASVQGNER